MANVRKWITSIAVLIATGMMLCPPWYKSWKATAYVDGPVVERILLLGYGSIFNPPEEGVMFTYRLGASFSPMAEPGFPHMRCVVPDERNKREIEKRECMKIGRRS
jgi:hypothetical protein